MLKIIKQNVGYSEGNTKLAVGLESDDLQELQEQWYSFANHSAPVNHRNKESELKKLDSPNFGYFYSTEQRFKKALEEAELFKILNNMDGKYNRYKDHSKEITAITPSLEQEAKRRAKIRYDSIPNEHFLTSDVYIDEVSRVDDMGQE